MLSLLVRALYSPSIEEDVDVKHSESSVSKDVGIPMRLKTTYR